MMKKHVLGILKDSFSRPELVPYLLPPQGNHGVLLGSLISSQFSGSSGHDDKEENEPSSMRSSPIQRWVDQACGYSSQQDFLPPTHIHELLSMID
jgi:hypothetical protein